MDWTLYIYISYRINEGKIIFFISCYYYWSFSKQCSINACWFLLLFLELKIKDTIRRLESKKGFFFQKKKNPPIHDNLVSLGRLEHRHSTHCCPKLRLRVLSSFTNLSVVMICSRSKAFRVMTELNLGGVHPPNFTRGGGDGLPPLKPPMTA